MPHVVFISHLRDKEYKVDYKAEQWWVNHTGTVEDCVSALRRNSYRVYPEDQPVYDSGMPEKCRWVQGPQFKCEIFDYENSTPQTSETYSG